MSFATYPSISSDLLTQNSPMAAMGDTTPPKNPRQDGYGYNPRCIKRDISGYLVQRDSTYAKIAALITNSKTIGTFQDTMQAGTGVHSAGHFTVSGDPGSGKHIQSSRRLSATTANDLNRLLHFTRGPVLLASPLADRPNVVDLADTGLCEQTTSNCWRNVDAGWWPSAVVG